MQAQLEMAQEQRKNLDLASGKKRVKDYEQMLKYYTLMRMKKEWWEVAKEYFTKELENNLAQHRANERILRYKLKAYK